MRLSVIVVCVLAIAGTACSPLTVLRMTAGAGLKQATAAPGCVSTHDAFAVRFQPAIAPKPGITIVPLDDDRTIAMQLAADLRREVTVPVQVTHATRIGAHACDEQGGRIMAEVALRDAAGVAEDGMLVLLVTPDELGSEQFQWQFGAWMSSQHEGIGVISSRRLAQLPPRNVSADQARRARIAVLARRYVLAGWFGTAERPTDPDTSLLTSKYSLTQLDRAAPTRLCDHQRAVRQNGTQLRNCAHRPPPRQKQPTASAPAGASIAQQVSRNMVATACAELRAGRTETQQFWDAVRTIDFVAADVRAGARLRAATSRLATHPKRSAAIVEEINRAARQLGTHSCIPV